MGTNLSENRGAIDRALVLTDLINSQRQLIKLLIFLASFGE